MIKDIAILVCMTVSIFIVAIGIVSLVWRGINALYGKKGKKRVYYLNLQEEV